MVDEIVPWLFEEEHLIRSVERNGEPWFVGLDVCLVLGIRDHKQKLDGLDEDERGRYITPTPGGPQEMIVVSEPGVFRLVFTSRKPVAERFKRWIAHDVLPVIRKTGRYEASSSIPPVEPVLPRSFDEWTAAEMNSKVGAVAEYRMSIGPQAGQWAMQRLGFPMPPTHMLPRARQYELDLRPNSQA